LIIILVGVSVDFVVHLGHAYNSYETLAVIDGGVDEEKIDVEENVVGEREAEGEEGIEVDQEKPCVEQKQQQQQQLISIRGGGAAFWALFRRTERQRGKRAQHALRTIGYSVASAGVTTALSASLLFGCTITFFSKFGAFLVLAMLAALFFSFVGFVPALALCGPTTEEKEEEEEGEGEDAENENENENGVSETETGGGRVKRVLKWLCRWW